MRVPGFPSRKPDQKENNPKKGNKRSEKSGAEAKGRETRLPQEIIDMIMDQVTDLPTVVKAMDVAQDWRAAGLNSLGKFTKTRSVSFLAAKVPDFGNFSSDLKEIAEAKWLVSVQRQIIENLPVAGKIKAAAQWKQSGASLTGGGNFAVIGRNCLIQDRGQRQVMSSHESKELWDLRMQTPRYIRFGDAQPIHKDARRNQDFRHENIIVASDGRCVLVYNEQSHVQLFALGPKGEPTLLADIPRTVFRSEPDVVFTADARFVLARDFRSGIVNVYDVKNGALIGNLGKPEPKLVEYHSFWGYPSLDKSISPDGRWFQAASPDGGIQIFDIAQVHAQISKKLVMPTFLDAIDQAEIRFVNGGKNLVAVTDDLDIAVWESGGPSQECHAFVGLPMMQDTPTEKNNSSLFLLTSKDKSVPLRELVKKMHDRLRGYDDAVGDSLPLFLTMIDFSNPAKPKKLPLEFDASGFYDIDESPDRFTVLVTRKDRSQELINFRSQKPESAVTILNASLPRVVAFSPSGNHLVRVVFGHAISFSALSDPNTLTLSIEFGALLGWTGGGRFGIIREKNGEISLFDFDCEKAPIRVTKLIHQKADESWKLVDSDSPNRLALQQSNGEIRYFSYDGTFKAREKHRLTFPTLVQKFISRGK